MKKDRGIENADFKQGSILNLPFPDKTFSVAFTHATLWTVSDPIAALQELTRVVKPGGIIASREPSSEGLLYYPPKTPSFKRLFSSK
ncbi:MAG: class I SAM-dependent methyltransferase [Chlamydiia bacterium]|nr:class I SAM-dependent methyltransferase [Chlamydiia bacterium]